MIIAAIVSQHAEEVAFLWLLRSNPIGQPHYGLKDLSKLDDRVEAHLDGLRVAGAMSDSVLGGKVIGCFSLAATKLVRL